MSRAPSLTVAVFALALMACIAAAHAADGITLKGRGLVEAVDAPRERFVVRLAPLPKPLTLAWDKDTQFLRGQQPATASALEAGQEIEIRYRLSSSGRHHATRIVILSVQDGARKPARSSTSTASKSATTPPQKTSPPCAAAAQTPAGPAVPPPPDFYPLHPHHTANQPPHENHPHRARSFDHIPTRCPSRFGTNRQRLPRLYRLRESADRSIQIGNRAHETYAGGIPREQK